jgi:hypothetical protein
MLFSIYTAIGLLRAAPLSVMKLSAGRHNAADFSRRHEICAPTRKFRALPYSCVQTMVPDDDDTTTTTTDFRELK